MSWHFLQGQEVESWEGSSLDGAPSALLKLMPTPALCSSLASETDSCRGSQFGMTCGPLTGDRGEAESTSLQEASRAKTSAQREADSALTESAADCGQRWPGSLAKWDRDTLSWRTRQHSLFGGLTEFSETWPTWGLMLDGELLAQETAAFPTKENASGSWPTPKARDWRSGGTDPQKVQKRIERRRNQGVIDLPDAAVHRLWRPGLTGLLNPSFSEALMEWPIGWTECGSLETGKFREWLRLHGGS